MLIYEFYKGEESFWWPYLDLLPQCDHLVWDLDRTLYIKEAQCQKFYELATEEFNFDGKDLFQFFTKIIEDYCPTVFKKPEFLTKSLFNRIYGCVISRCFGYGVPYTSLIPMADFHNHTD